VANLASSYIAPLRRTSSAIQGLDSGGGLQTGGTSYTAPAPPTNQISPQLAAARQAVAATPPDTQAAVRQMFNPAVYQNVPGAPQGGTTSSGVWGDPFTGRASIYDPGHAGMTLANPEGVGLDVARAMGFNRQGNMGAANTLSRIMKLAPALYMLFNAGNPNAFSEEAQLNFLQDLGRNYLTPGGRAVSTQAVLGQIFNNPAVAETIRGGTEADQINMVNNLLGMVAGMSSNDMLGAMMQAITNRLGMEYQSLAARGQAKTPYDEWAQQQLQAYGWMPRI
jgi:hypothetical protein